MATTISVIALLALLNVATAIVPSLGLSTVQTERANFSDCEFLIDFAELPTMNTPNFSVSAAFLPATRALAGADVQATLFELRIPSGNTVGLHYHPRAAESLYMRRGALRVSFRYEGGADARVVTNVVRRGRATVIPEALLHEFTCVSDADCISFSVLNSADAGAVFIPV